MAQTTEADKQSFRKCAFSVLHTHRGFLMPTLCHRLPICLTLLAAGLENRTAGGREVRAGSALLFLVQKEMKGKPSIRLCGATVRRGSTVKMKSRSIQRQQAPLINISERDLRGKLKKERGKAKVKEPSQHL